MDSTTLVLLILSGFYCALIVFWFLREIFLWKKEDMREPRTVGLVSGKEVVERMLAEAGIEGVSVVPGDKVIQRYYYSPRKKRIVISTHACYNSGYYEVMRAATTAANAVQREEGVGMIDLYLWLAPVMEWMVRCMPMVIVAGLYCVYLYPTLVICLVLAIWVLLIVLVLLMRPIDKDAARRSCEWLIGHGIVPENGRKQLERTGRYLTNYNLVLLVSAYFALLFTRLKWYSDKTV
ncbi:MAG: zinc metallopeptidase [Bacteroidales bacterium]|nr:zinc metallopeptidase [Bacteroidales bacterium]